MSARVLSFPVLGRRLEAAVRSPALAAWLRREWDFPEHAAPPSPCGIELEELAAGPAALEGDAVEARLHGLTLRAVAADDRWSFGSGDAGVRLGLLDSGACISVWGCDRGGEMSALFAALYVSLAEALRASGLLPLHAAVVVREGQATALAGGSGAGKSSTLWRALQAGWAPLAEDMAWLDPATDVIYGWDRALRLRPDALARLAPGLSTTGLARDAAGKVLLPFENLPARPARAATLARLAILERTSSSGAGVRAVADRDAVRAWWEATGLPLSGATRISASQAITGLVRRLPTVRLPTGPLTGALEGL